jgi:hypothetical protein
MNRLRLQFPESLHGWLSLASICLLQTGCATLHPTTEVTTTRSMLTEIAATEAVPAQPVFDALQEITENTPNGGETPTAGTTADRQPLNFTMQSPNALQWKNCALSAGGRSLQYCTTGDGTFRTLIIGSTLGNDPAAVELTEKLATHLHDNSLIYGGFQVLVIRTLNPDGAAENRPVNAFGQIINRQFPSESNGPVANCPEAQLLMRLIQNERPDRILHIRTIQSPVGALGSDSGLAPLVVPELHPISLPAGYCRRNSGILLRQQAAVSGDNLCIPGNNGLNRGLEPLSELPAESGSRQQCRRNVTQISSSQPLIFQGKNKKRPAENRRPQHIHQLVRVTLITRPPLIKFQPA